MFNVLILHILARRLNGRRGAEIPILGLSCTTMHDASIETYISFSLEISRPKVPSASSSLGRSVVRSLACIVGNQCRRHFLPFECMPSNRFCMPSNVSRRIDSTTGLGHSLHDLRIHQCRMPFGCQRLAQRWQRVSCAFKDTLVYILQFMRDSVFCSVHNVST